jgi:hypothetical protein
VRSNQGLSLAAQMKREDTMAAEEIWRTACSLSGLRRASIKRYVSSIFPSTEWWRGRNWLVGFHMLRDTPDGSQAFCVTSIMY